MRYGLPLIVVWIFVGFGCIGQSWYRIQDTERKMGTTFSITCYARDSIKARALISESWSRIDQLNLIFSNYLEESEAIKISQAAGTNRWITLSPEFSSVLKESLKLSKLSEGAFDITIGPLSKLWRRAIRRGELPSDEMIMNTLRKVGFEKIQFDESTDRIRLLTTGMQLDFGGIAKGYTVDEVWRIFRDNGMTKVLIDAGGDIYAGEAPPGTEGWEIAVGDTQEILQIQNAAIAGSGDRFQFLTIDGRRYSHIIDPRIGKGVEGPRETYVESESCMIADALASTINIMGHEKANGLLQAYPSSALLSHKIFSGKD